MKKFIYVFLSIIPLAFSAQQKSGDIQKVLQNMQNQEAAWNNADIKGFMEYYLKGDSLMFVGSKGVTYGWQNTFNNYVKNYPDKKTMGELKFEIIKVTQISDENIFMVGKWKLFREVPAGGHFTLLWKKIKGEWLIICDHTS